MKNNQKILIGILFVLLTAGAGCIGETQNFEFEYKISDGVSGGHLKDIKWDNDTLIINAIVTTRCSGGDENFRLLGNYRLYNNTIQLVVTEKRTPGIYPRCLEDYEITFKIKNLQKKSYKISLYTDVMGQGKLLIDEKII